MREYFKILELQYDATEDELKASFRRLSKKFHPDHNNGSDQFSDNFRLVKEAYKKLLLFMKSTEYKKWKSKQHKKHERAKTAPSDTTEENAGCDKFNDFNSSSSQFNYYEFINNKGLFEEELFSSHSGFLQKQYSLHEVIETETFEYKILNFQFEKEIGNPFSNTKSDGVFIIIELEIVNISKKTFSIHNYMYRLFDIDGFFYEFSNSGLVALNFSNEHIIPFFGKEQNPKIKSKYKIVFEVPEADEYFLQLCGGQYEWDDNNICICNETVVVKLANGS